MKFTCNRHPWDDVSKHLISAIEVPSLIGLTGVKESGKDAVAAFLSMLGYRRYAFADEVRYEVLEHLRKRDRCGEVVLPPYMSIPEQSVYAAYKYCPPEEVFAKPTSLLARKVLQHWGTEYRRAQNPDYWVDKLVTRAQNETRPIVITDVSFGNEAEFISKWDGVLWRVKRSTSDPNDTHVSELNRASLAVDHTINNTGDLMHLSREIQGALEGALQCFR